MRFLAALSVFFFHVAVFRIFEDTQVSEGIAYIFSRAGWIGVSFFFVLSGFILTWAAKPNDSMTAFWRRRFFKVFPNHVVTYALAMVLFAGATVGGGTAVLNLLLLQSWVPSEDVYFSVNLPSWSLGCEMLFYLLFPLLHRWIGRIRPQALWGVAIGLLLVIAVLPLIAGAFLPARPTVVLPPGEDVSEAAYWFLYIFPATRVLDFVLGIVLARVVLTGRWIGIGLLPLTVLFVFCYAAALEAPQLYGLVALTAVPLALMIPETAMLDVRKRETWLRTRPMQWLGEVSFAFYLVQWPVLLYGQELLGVERKFSLLTGTGVLLACFGITLLIAWLLYIGVERPAMRRWSKPRDGRKAPEKSRTAA
ncbi:acyltransferase [Streptomyces sp. DG2A-72]|uniref:acyltransferase family protein n=1 Tax=Streptomyces sp. DG2A-72 TaxID=3051386 RepID=UPI00265B7E94|nr:acyltransferase [Streptomyces sp. DG2A-72]MDO0939345.1 acyltransferase [Streptomyces sp. DG2A-72]